MTVQRICHLTEDKIGGPGLLVGRLRNGDQLFVQRLKKPRGRPRLWQAFIVVETNPAADVICRALKAMKEKAQTHDPR